MQSKKIKHDSPLSDSQKVIVPTTVTQPPTAWLDPRPQSYPEYQEQIKKWLCLNDGREAKAVDNKSVKCVCNKIIRCNSRYYWKYLIQKPTLKFGKIIHKGKDYSITGLKIRYYVPCT